MGKIYSFKTKLTIFMLFIVFTTVLLESYERVSAIKTLRTNKAIKGFHHSVNLFKGLFESDIMEEDKRKDILNIAEIIKANNIKQEVYNAEIFEPVNDTTQIIVIHIRSDVEGLKYLIKSLRLTRFIESCLLIFSHGNFNPEMNDVIRSINFAKYMQIFYPFPSQLYRNCFPGPETGAECGEFCKQFNNRDDVAAKAAQEKHHWWWQMNQVFDNIEITKDNVNPIFFLNENNYVTKDFVLTSQWLISIRKRNCPQCQMISLGASKHLETSTIEHNYEMLLSVEEFGKNTSRTGIGFDRNLWHTIKTRTFDFCFFNDFTWDNTLEYMLKKIDNHIYVMAFDVSKVFYTFRCPNNIRTSQKICIDENALRLIKQSNRRVLSARNFTMKFVPIVKSPEVEPRGYFGDSRDQALCVYFSQNNVLY